jgi:hypothetical protein
MRDCFVGARQRLAPTRKIKSFDIIKSHYGENYVLL